MGIILCYRKYYVQKYYLPASSTTIHTALDMMIIVPVQVTPTIRALLLPNLDTIVPATSIIQAAMSIQIIVTKWDTIKHTMLMMAQIVIEVPKHNRTVLNWLALHKSSKKWYMYHYRY